MGETALKTHIQDYNLCRSCDRKKGGAAGVGSINYQLLPIPVVFLFPKKIQVFKGCVIRAIENGGGVVRRVKTV